MGAAYYIVLDTDIEGVDIDMNGKALAGVNDEDAHQKEITSALAAVGLQPLLAYFSQDPAELLGLMFEIDPDDATPEQLAQLPAENWFDAATGIKVFDTIAAWVNENKSAVDHAEAVLADIADARRIISYGAEHDVRWHLAIDY